MTVAPTITAGGVLLTPITDEDAENWLAGEDEAQVSAFEFPGRGTLDDVRRAIGNWRAGWSDNGTLRQWALRDDTTGDLAGGVELRALGDWCVVNLSYVVFPLYRGRGFATSAARAALVYARSYLATDLASLEILQGNAPSRRVAVKLGAKWVGTSPSHAGSTFDRWHVDAHAVSAPAHA